MQPSSHDIVPNVPVVDRFVSNGRVIPIRCAGDYTAKLQALRLLTHESVPQPARVMQHDFVDVSLQPA